MSQLNQPDPIDDLLLTVWAAALDAKAMMDEEDAIEQHYLNKQKYHLDRAKAALNQLMLRERLAGAKQIVQSITKEHELVKKKNAITLAEQHGYFYAVRDASLEMRALAQLVEAGGEA